MNMIHQVVASVVGLTDLNEISLASARLLVDKFSFDAVLITFAEKNSFIRSQDNPDSPNRLTYPWT